MLNEKNYIRGKELNEQLKFNIAYDKTPIFNIVCSKLASRLLQSEYASELTEDERNKLECLINN